MVEEGDIGSISEAYRAGETLVEDEAYYARRQLVQSACDLNLRGVAECALTLATTPFRRRVLPPLAASRSGVRVARRILGL